MTSLVTPQMRISESVAYGYGWQVLRTSGGSTVIAHNGAESGLDHYSTLRHYVDEDVVVVMLANSPEDVVIATQRALFAALSAYFSLA